MNRSSDEPGLTRREALVLMPVAALSVARSLHASAAMIEREIPGTGERLPVIGLGTWQTFDVGAAPAERAPLEEVLRGFVRLGGKLIDSSPMYGRSEQVAGELTAKLGIHDKLFWATKVWTRGEGPGVRQMEESMRLLRTPRLDLMQVHNLLDADAHLRTLKSWKEQGRIRYIGITHYTVSSYPELEAYLRKGGIDFVQFNYSLATRAAEQRLLPACQELGVATLINRPFESGEMFGRIRGKPLPAWAADIDCTSWGQIFLKYIVSHAGVTCAIPATSDPRHLEDNMSGGMGKLPDAALRQRIAAEWERL